MAEHPLLTKDRDTGVKGHHHTTEHVELHHHLRLDIEREEKSQNLKYLKIKTELRVAEVYIPQMVQVYFPNTIPGVPVFFPNFFPVTTDNSHLRL